MDCSLITDLEFGENAVFALHFNSVINENDIKVYTRELQIQKSQNEEDEIYKNIPSLNTNQFPLIARSEQDYHIYFEKKFNDIADASIFAVFYIETPDKMIDEKFLFKYSENMDMDTSSPVRVNIGLSKYKPFILNIKYMNGKTILLGSEKVNHKIYDGSIVIDDKTIKTPKETQIHLIEKNDSEIVVVEFNTQEESEVFYFYFEEVKNQTIKYLENMRDKPIMVNCVENLNQFFVSVVTQKEEMTSWLSFHKQYGSFEYYFRSDISRESVNFTLLPFESDKVTSFQELKQDFFVLKVVCLKPGRLEILFLNDTAENPKPIDNYDQISKFVQSGKEYQLDLDSQIDQSNIEVRITEMGIQSKGTITVEIGTKKLELVDLASVARFSKVSVANKIKITSGFNAALAIKIAKNDLFNEVYQITDSDNEMTLKEAHGLFKFEQERVLSYLITLSSNAFLDFKYSIGKGIDGFIPYPNIPASVTPNEIEFLSIDNPYTRYAGELEDNEFYYIAISVTDSNHYSVTFNGNRLPTNELHKQKILNEMKPNKKYSLDFSLKKNKPILAMYSALCIETEVPTYKFYYNDELLHSSEVPKEKSILFYDNEYMPVEFEYSIIDSSVMYNSYGYIDDMEKEQLPNIIFGYYAFAFDNVNQLTWARPSPTVTKFRIYIYEKNGDSMDLSNECKMYKSPEYEEVSGIQFTFDNEKYKYNNYTVNILAFDDWPIPYFFLYKQQDIEFKDPNPVDPDPDPKPDPDPDPDPKPEPKNNYLWLWILLGFIALVVIVVAIVLVRRSILKKEANQNKEQENSLLPKINPLV